MSTIPLSLLGSRGVTVDIGPKKPSRSPQKPRRSSQPTAPTPDAWPRRC